jgi:hypothetical protein
LSDGRNALVAESVDDTLRDIIGYAVLALLWLDDNRDVDSTIRQIATMVMSENKE